MIYPKDRPLLEESLARPEKHRAPFTLRWIRPDGNLIWTETRSTPAYEDGRLIGLDGVTRDVTAQKLAEEDREDLMRRLEGERSKLDRLIELAPLPIVTVTSGRANPVRVNERARKLFGFEPLLPQDQWAFLDSVFCRDGKKLSREESATFRALNGNDVFAEEELIQAPGRKPVPVLVSSTSIRDQTGKVIGALTMAEDISSIKELERMREEWASVIAHDLRQPITAIEMQGQLLTAKPQDVELVKRVATYIGTSARQLNRMTKDLLDVSSLEAQRLALDRKATKLDRLVREVIDRGGISLEGRRLRIEEKEELPEVWVDPGRMEQVIGNLLSNAVKYSYPDSEIVLHIGSRDGQVELSVTNAGQGIDAADLKLLFQRFHRTRLARDKKIKGIGLGLYITKGLVEAHGGRIEAESEPGKTTTFRVSLPLIEARRAA